MISQLKGFIIDVSMESATLDVGGVGYELLCSLNTLAELQAGLHTNTTGASARLTTPVTVYTYTHVREDALQLFGFSTKSEKHLFTTLLKVNGIGPKMALNIVSGGTVEYIHGLIESEDVKGLSKLPKVGKKTAEQMILALKGKLVVHEADKVLSSRATLPNILSGSVAQREVSSALVNLGFRPVDVEKVISQMDPEMDLQEGIRQGLAALSSL
ncbi:MAG: Holliday junction branch migration protein RuvA [Bdellovibrio sp. CG10_big_fil_rev_8_21_14_0_10_47_8]|nr:MAG: Holliday junction branch migration protein RuvA [Bdellovibrio sp. CG10_big_fil_rev_8_21_14_0_10_47_8]